MIYVNNVYLRIVNSIYSIILNLYHFSYFIAVNADYHILY